MTREECKEVIKEKKYDTAYFDESLTEEEMYSMLHYRMQFGEAETKVIIAALVLAGAKFKKQCEITQELLDVIATYMDDEKREQVHCELAPCTPDEFLKRYVEIDPDFKLLLRDEFKIEM